MRAVLPIRFERTANLALVRQILTVPAVYRAIGEDGAPDIADYQPPDHPGIWYVLAFEAEELLGCFAFYPEGEICWQVHTCLLPFAHTVRGRTLRAAKAVIEWMWSNSPCLRITTKVPGFNPLALRLARKAGMIEFGTNTDSFRKHGRLWDQVLLGISRPTMTNCSMPGVQ